MEGYLLTKKKQSELMIEVKCPELLSLKEPLNFNDLNLYDSCIDIFTRICTHSFS